MRFLLIAFIAATAVACSDASNAPATASAEKAPSAAPGDHAGEGVKAGSHEDWCGEHAMPESKCTRCNSKLIPAFKATKDWCEEHALPESQCTKCNPDIKIVRPPKGS